MTIGAQDFIFGTQTIGHQYDMLMKIKWDMILNY